MTARKEVYLIISYLRHFVDLDKKYIYAILAIDREGKEGNPALTSVSFESPAYFQGVPFLLKNFFLGHLVKNRPSYSSAELFLTIGGENFPPPPIIPG